MVSGTVDRFLQKDVALRMLYPKVEPNLICLDYFTPIQEDKSAFLYMTDSAGISGDSKKKKPARYENGAQFPEIDFSQPSTLAAATESQGFSVRLPRKIIREKAGIAAITDYYSRAGYWLAEAMNTEILSTLTGGATTPTWTPSAVWSESTANPVGDIINLSEQMEREGYPFRLTDCFINKTNWYELVNLITAKDSSANGMMGVGADINGDVVTMPYTGVKMHKVLSGLTEGYCLGIDQNNPSAELHYFIDEAYSSASVRYQTIENNKQVWKTANNLGIHFKQYEEDDTHDTIMQFWYDFKPVVTQAYGILYDSGI